MYYLQNFDLFRSIIFLFKHIAGYEIYIVRSLDIEFSNGFEKEFFRRKIIDILQQMI
jgi:hypothetical protein